MFEIVDGRTDGRTPEHGYTISSPCEPKGELKSKGNDSYNVVGTWVGSK